MRRGQTDSTAVQGLTAREIQVLGEARRGLAAGAKARASLSHWPEMALI